ncbi:hypothetical protein F5B17DRAFT_428013 [Nemania serpens]|nr:hypothetical protein F5B17DRAFT_428013 [Nemania serpens]
MPPGFGNSSYYDRSHRQSPALIRARKPYLVKNAVVGSAIAVFAVGVLYGIAWNTDRNHLGGQTCIRFEPLGKTISRTSRSLIRQRNLGDDIGLPRNIF